MSRNGFSPSFWPFVPPKKRLPTACLLLLPFLLNACAGLSSGSREPQALRLRPNGATLPDGRRVGASGAEAYLSGEGCLESLALYREARKQQSTEEEADKAFGYLGAALGILAGSGITALTGNPDSNSFTIGISLGGLLGYIGGSVLPTALRKGESWLDKMERAAGLCGASAASQSVPEAAPAWPAPPAPSKLEPLAEDRPEWDKDILMAVRSARRGEAGAALKVSFSARGSAYVLGLERQDSWLLEYYRALGAQEPERLMLESARQEQLRRKAVPYSRGLRLGGGLLGLFAGVALATDIAAKSSPSGYVDNHAYVMGALIGLGAAALIIEPLDRLLARQPDERNAVQARDAARRDAAAAFNGLL